MVSDARSLEPGLRGAWSEVCQSIALLLALHHPKDLHSKPLTFSHRDLGDIVDIAMDIAILHTELMRIGGS